MKQRNCHCSLMAVFFVSVSEEFSKVYIRSVSPVFRIKTRLFPRNSLVFMKIQWQNNRVYNFGNLVNPCLLLSSSSAAAATSAATAAPSAETTTTAATTSAITSAAAATPTCTATPAVRIR